MVLQYPLSNKGTYGIFIRVVSKVFIQVLFLGVFIRGSYICLYGSYICKKGLASIVFKQRKTYNIVYPKP